MENILKDILKKAGIETSTLSPQQEEQLRVHEEIFHENEIKKEILIYFHECSKNNVTGRGKKIGELTEEGKKILSHLCGEEMKDLIDFRLNPSDMKHIFNNHYGKHEKDTGNNYALTDSDIMNMLDVISKPDFIMFGIDKKHNNKMFFFFKSNDVGTYNLAEIYSDRSGNLTAKSFYNTKKGISQRVMIIKDTLLPTSVTYFGESLSNAKIPKLFKLTTPERQIIAPTMKKDINQQPLFMMDKKGEIYGYALGNRIVLTQKGLNPETMVHEYTHIWCTAMRNGNTEGWQSIKALLRDTSLWQSIVNDPLYVDIHNNDDYITSEALARISGRENSSKLKSLYEKEELKIGDNSTVTSRGMFNRLKKALESLWSWVGKHMFDIQYFNSVNEITDRVLFDLLKGRKIEINKPYIQLAQGENPRITKISIYKNNVGDPYVRCKIDGVQLLGIKIKNKDLHFLENEMGINTLVDRYFKEKLEEQQNRSFKR